MWSGIQDSIAAANDNPIKAVNSGMDVVLGPSFDYLQTIESPTRLGVGDSGNIDQIFTNVGAIRTYVNRLVRGPKTGNQFFRDTGGLCKAPGGGLVQRYTWINNKLGMDDAAGILGDSFANAVSGSGFDGLIPGAGGDIAALNPLKIMNGMVLDGVPKCKAYTCTITNIVTGADSGEETQFITPSLEFNLRGCKEADNQAAREAAAVDSYAKWKNGFDKTEEARKKKEAAEDAALKAGKKEKFDGDVLVKYDSGPAILLGLAFIALFFGLATRRSK